MAKQLKDLIDKSFLEMPYEEKLSFLQGVRTSRRTPKATSKVVRSKKKSTAKVKDKLDILFENLSDAEKQAFMEGLSK